MFVQLLGQVGLKSAQRCDRLEEWAHQSPTLRMLDRHARHACPDRQALKS
jgi:hypothetical protein